MTAVDLTTHDVSYDLVTPALASSTYYVVRGPSQAGTSLHVTEVRTRLEEVRVLETFKLFLAQLAELFIQDGQNDVYVWMSVWIATRVEQIVTDVHLDL